MSVFVLDKRKKPLMPCTEKRARKLLESGRARVHKLFPFTIRLIDLFQKDCVLQPIRLSIDPGSKTTGIAVCRVSSDIDIETGEVSLPVMHIQFLMELIHRGAMIKKSLKSRSAMRRRRRSANLRYREPRFLNKGNKKQGWIAPSLQHRVDTIETWVKRLIKLAPITHLAQELVRFDMQKIQAQAAGQDITGIEYQQGTLFGYEIREYLLAKFDRTCVYCDAKDVSLQIDHIHPKSKGGSNRISNLTLACSECNQKKNAQDIKDYLKKDPKRLAKILKAVKTPLHDAAAVNTTRWTLFNRLKTFGLPVSASSGALTKYNRIRLKINKTHALDAACVGDVKDVLQTNVPTLTVKCMGRGSHCRTRLDAYGFPKGYVTCPKSVKGFTTGDMVIANVNKGKKMGVYQGRVAIRKTGSFNIQTSDAVIEGINHKYCQVISKGDGYNYARTSKTLLSSTQ